MFKNTAEIIAKYLKSFLKWILLSIVIGCLGGVVGSLFHIAIEQVTELRIHHTWLVYLLPFGAVVIALVYGFFKKYGALNTDRIIKAVQGEEEVSFILAPLIFFGATITHLVGGSAGREGAALQLGGSIGYRVGKLVRLSSKDLSIVVITGMASVFSALFGTPVTAAIFSLEVAVVGSVNYRGFLPCIAASFVAYITSGLFGIEPVRYASVITGTLTLGFVLKTTLLALLVALVSILFLRAISGCSKLSKKYIPNAYVRSVVLAAVILGLTLLEGSGDYNGAGMNIVGEALKGNARYEAFILKILFTVLSLAAGFKGGEIVPTFFIGSTFGCVAASVLGMDASLGAALGFVALFCCVVNCPIASLFLAIEVFGTESVGVFAYVIAVSFMFSGKGSLYKSQKILL